MTDDTARPPEQPDQTAQIAALAATVERLARRLDSDLAARRAADDSVTGLRAAVDGLGARADQADAGVAAADGHIRALAQLLQTVQKNVQKLTGPGSGGPVCWLTQGPPGPARAGGPGDPPDQPARLTADEAAAALDDLARWLSDVYLRYPGAALSSCWAWHPAVVEELWWLRGAHIEAYIGRVAAWRAVGAWHEQLRPGVVKRVNLWIGDCDLTRHSLIAGDCPDRGAPPVPLAAHLPEVARRWSEFRETPPPDAHMIRDAIRHDGMPARR